MRRRSLLLLAVFAAAGLAADVEPNDSQIQEIIAKFAAKEAEFSRARENYTYRQTVRVQELDESKRVRGKFEIIADIIFSPEGKRTERVVHAPVSTLQRIQLTPEDEQDLRNVQPFVLTTQEIPKYHVRYLGRQTLDEIPCYVFAVKPKEMLKGERYFAGIVWVDDRDLQIVKTYGRGVGLKRKNYDNQFPKFETYRQQIDGKYWFPTYTYADDVLMFQTGPQPIKMIVKYEDYKQFKAEAEVKYGEPVESKSPAKP
ncbi:MAG: outer membrane lipoprotein-sorting protein [Bryobacteraceae bacterium]|nr:outer membrane lipoprotein-sorting protein [Bryobacteraceae bacterium]